jgi:hypothetical protein
MRSQPRYSVAFTAKGHLYIITADNPTAIIAHLLSIATNPQYNFNMYDALTVAHQIPNWK